MIAESFTLGFDSSQPGESYSLVAVLLVDDRSAGITFRVVIGVLLWLLDLAGQLLVPGNRSFNCAFDVFEFERLREKRESAKVEKFLAVGAILFTGHSGYHY